MHCEWMQQNAAWMNCNVCRRGESRKGDARVCVCVISCTTHELALNTFSICLLQNLNIVNGLFIEFTIAPSAVCCVHAANLLHSWMNEYIKSIIICDSGNGEGLVSARSMLYRCSRKGETNSEKRKKERIKKIAFISIKWSRASMKQKNRKRNQGVQSEYSAQNNFCNKFDDFVGKKKELVEA